MKITTTEDEEASSWLLEPQNKEPRRSTEPPPIWFSKRLQISIVLFFCFISSAMIRSNVMMAIVEMTSNKSITEGDVTVVQPPEFNWDSATVGFIVSTYSYGALLSFLGSIPVKALGGSRSCAISILMMGITTSLQPFFLQLNFYLFLICRFVTGLFEAFFNVSTAEIYSRWIPKKERSILVSYSYNGMNVGFTVSPLILGYLAHNWGWRMIFYATGTISITLSIFCFVLMKNQPSEDKNISEKELLYIQNETTATTRKKVAHSYKDALFSAPILAVIIVQFVICWVPTLLNVYFPLYIKDITHRNTDEVGLISSIPTSAQIIMYPLAGISLSYCKTHSNLTTTQIHKILLSVAMISSSLLFVAITQTSNFVISMGIFILIQIISSPVYLVVGLIVVSIAPNDTSAVAGLVTFSKAASNIVSRLVTGFMITNRSMQEWNNCFFLMAIVLFCGAVIFLIYGSSKAQSWSLDYSEEQEQKSDKH